jgi:hypothetical protein
MNLTAKTCPELSRRNAKDEKHFFVTFVRFVVKKLSLNLAPEAPNYFWIRIASVRDPQDDFAELFSFF